MLSSEIVLPEQRFLFANQGSNLVAVLHQPEGACRAGVILLHGWAGYRAGPHQMFVKLARQAAERGFCCLRFDFRGRGDSEGEAQKASLSTMISDAIRAAEVFAGKCDPVPLALVGDCSGSEVALGAAPFIQTVQRLVLWSAPPVGGGRQTMHRAKRLRMIGQYLRKAGQLRTWSRLLRREVRLDMVSRAVRSGGLGAGEQGQESDREINWRQRFLDFPGRILFVYGQNDPTMKACLEHYQELTEAAGRPWETHIVAGANHAFYSLAWEREVIATTLEWLAQWQGSLSADHG